MLSCTQKAYAKLNISLDVTGKRDNGYHDMVMVLQTVSLADTVRLSLDSSGRVRARTSLPFIPGDERNLAVKAALCYFEAIGMKDQGLFIDIDKKVPVGAGMGGGSSDAAAVLRGLNQLMGQKLSTAELEQLAAGVGSDVAFCVAGGTALATGRGEELKPLTAMPDCRLVICKPEFSISTPELFRKLDQAPVHNHPDTKGMLEGLEKADLSQICRRMYNVFEDVDDRRMRTVRQIKSILLDYQALGAMMTGTGSAVFGVFRPDQDTEELRSVLEKEYGFCQLAKPVGRLLP